MSRCLVDRDLDGLRARGLGPTQSAHLEGCPGCRGSLARLERVIELASTPLDAPSADHIEQSRTRLLALAAQTGVAPARRPRRYAKVMALAASLLLVGGGAFALEARHGVVSRWLSELSTSPEPSLPPRSTPRPLVVPKVAEPAPEPLPEPLPAPPVDVVVPVDPEPLLKRAKPPVARPRVAAPRRSPAPAPAPAPEATPEPKQSPADEAFQAAWRTLRAGRHAAAAAAFEGALQLEGGPRIAEDARYWRAVALRRAGRPDAAISAFASFLSRHPRAGRAPEAGALLGWLLFEAGRYEEAGERFEAARNAHVPAVRQSVLKGMAAVKAARKAAEQAPR